MSPRHHPSPEILAAYASGTLEPGFGLVVGAHVEGCAACRAHVGAFEATSGAALADVAPAAVSDNALAQVMARLEAPAVPQTKADTRPLLERLPLKAKKWIIPGVWVAAVDTPHAADNRVYLLSVAAGGLTARHEHEGREFCTVLKGAYRDELGLFSAGDFAAAEGELNHQPRVEGDEECICLFATEGRLKPQGFLARMVFGYANV